MVKLLYLTQAIRLSKAPVLYTCSVTRLQVFQPHPTCGCRWCSTTQGTELWDTTVLPSDAKLICRTIDFQLLAILVMGNPLNSGLCLSWKPEKLFGGERAPTFTLVWSRFQYYLRVINFIYSPVIVQEIKTGGSFTRVLWQINYLFFRGKTTAKDSTRHLKLQIFPLSSLLRKREVCLRYLFTKKGKKRSCLTK